MRLLISNQGKNLATAPPGCSGACQGGGPGNKVANPLNGVWLRSQNCPIETILPCQRPNRGAVVDLAKWTARDVRHIGNRRFRYTCNIAW